MKVKVEAYKIGCDCCGGIFCDSDGYVCFDGDVDGSVIRNEADSSGWMEIGDKHYCPNCYEINDNDEIVTKDGHKYDYDTREKIMSK